MNREGPPEGDPSRFVPKRGYGVTVIGWTTCVVPGVTLDVMAAIER